MSEETLAGLQRNYKISLQFWVFVYLGFVMYILFFNVAPTCFFSSHVFPIESTSHKTPPKESGTETRVSLSWVVM